MKSLKWSVPGKAIATILFPSTDPNHKVLALFKPGDQYEEAKRGWIGDRPTNDDLINIENFDHALKRIRKKEDRIIHVELFHETKEFTLYVVFSFISKSGNPGDIYEVKTNPKGITILDILVEI